MKVLMIAREQICLSIQR